jgi:hypothetical protein
MLASDLLRPVWRSVCLSQYRFSGPTVHFVDEEYDTGPILAQRCVQVFPTDSPKQLAARVLEQVRTALRHIYRQQQQSIRWQHACWRGQGETEGKQLQQQQRIRGCPGSSLTSVACLQSRLKSGAGILIELTDRKHQQQMSCHCCFMLGYQHGLRAACNSGCCCCCCCVFAGAPGVPICSVSVG